MSRIPVAIVVALCGALTRVSAQDSEVEKYIGMVNTGRVEEVRGEIPGLLARYPNDPGVLYVQALVTKDGAEAARIYQSVVDNFPKSKYADASLYRLYQYYYALGLYRTADLTLAQLRQEYPGSQYLTKSGVVDPASLKEEPETAPQQDHLSIDKNDLVAGQTATLSWRVTAAEEVILTINGIAETIPMRTIFNGIVSFFVAEIACVVILILFPDLVTWLPRVAGYKVT